MFNFAGEFLFGFDFFGDGIQITPRFTNFDFLHKPRIKYSRGIVKFISKKFYIPGINIHFFIFVVGNLCADMVKQITIIFKN